MARLLGNAAITWTSTDGDKVFELRAPLRNVRPAVKQLRFVRESMDFSTRSVTTVGNGIHELVGSIRYVDAPQTLMDMLLAGIRGTTLTLVPDVDDPERSFDCELIEPNEMPTAIMDPDSGLPGFEWNAIDIRLRRTDGSPFIL